MSLIRLVVLVTISLTSMACEQWRGSETHQGATAAGHTDELAIRELSQSWDAAMRAGDVEQLIGFYASDAVIYEPGLPQITGADALRQHLVELAAFDVRVMETEIREIEVAASGDLAIEIGHSRWEWQEPRGRMVEQGPYLVVWKKGSDGWRVSREIFNSDQPLPPRAPEPAR